VSKSYSGGLFHVMSGIMIYIGTSMDVDEYGVTVNGPQMIEIALIQNKETGQVEKQTAKRRNSFKIVPWGKVDCVDATDLKDMDQMQRALYSDLSSVALVEAPKLQV